MLTTWLGKKGFRVQSVSSVKEAKQRMEGSFYDLVLSDLRLPDSDGIALLHWMKKQSITVPVIPGVMPITNANQVEKAVKLSGSFMPQRFKSLVDRFGSDPAAMKQAGIAYATDQIIDLYANGITNVHIYSMNKPDVAEKIQANLSDILGK